MGSISGVDEIMFRRKDIKLKFFQKHVFIWKKFFSIHYYSQEEEYYIRLHSNKKWESMKLKYVSNKNTTEENIIKDSILELLNNRPRDLIHYILS